MSAARRPRADVFSRAWGQFGVRTGVAMALALSALAGALSAGIADALDVRDGAVLVPLLACLAAASTAVLARRVSERAGPLLAVLAIVAVGAAWVAEVPIAWVSGDYVATWQLVAGSVLLAAGMLLGLALRGRIRRA